MILLLNNNTIDIFRDGTDMGSCLSVWVPVSPDAVWFCVATVNAELAK